MSLKIAFGIVSVLVVDIISVLIFGTVSVLVSDTVLVLFFDLSLNFSLQNDDINNFEGSKFGTDVVPDFGPSDYLLRFSEIYISFPIVIGFFFCHI